jgi:hypothetical protein
MIRFGSQMIADMEPFRRCQPAVDSNAAFMLLALRSLFEAAADKVLGGHKNREIQRKLRRLAQWSEVSAPAPAILTRPPSNVIVEGDGIHPALLELRPEIAAAGEIRTSDVSVDGEGAFLELRPRTTAGEIDAKVDLLEDEYLALALILGLS